MVLAQADARHVAGVDDRLDAVRPVLVGSQDLEADPVEPHERAAPRDLDVLVGRRGLTLVADQAAPEIHPLLLEDVLLDIASL